MVDSESFTAIIVSPDEILFDGEVTKMVAPGHSMDIAILPNHTPLYAQLAEGEIVFTQSGGETKTIKIDGGILRVKRNKASVIVGFDALLSE